MFWCVDLSRGGFLLTLPRYEIDLTASRLPFLGLLPKYLPKEVRGPPKRIRRVRLRE